MITTQNEFQAIKAFTYLAGSNLGTWSDRETTHTMIKLVDMCNCGNGLAAHRLMSELAMLDDDSDCFYEIQEECAEYLNDHVEPYCSVSLDDGEWRVAPHIDEELPTFDHIPESRVDDLDGYIYHVNDHGNVDLLSWDYNKSEYTVIWSMV